MKKTLIIILAVLGVQVYAQRQVYGPLESYVVGSLTYRLLSDSTAEVVERQSSCLPYVGDIVVPASVIVQGQVYKVVRIGDAAFVSCNIHNITLPSTIEEIGEESFMGMQGTSMVLPSSLRSIGPSAFAYSFLTELKIPDNVDSIGEYAFYRSKIARFTVGQNNTHFVAIDSLALYSNDTAILVAYAPACSTTSAFTVPAGVREIRSGALDVVNLSSVQLPEGLRTIGTYSFGSEMGSLHIPASVTHIIGALLPSPQDGFVLTLSPDNRNYRMEDGMLVSNAGDTLLMSINSSDTLMVPLGVRVIGECAMSENSRNRVVVLPEGVEEICNAAFLNTSAQIEVPRTVRIIGAQAFYSNTGTDEFDIPQVERIGDYAFFHSPVREIQVTDSLRIIGEYAFYGCQNLSEFDWGNGLEEIGQSAFAASELGGTIIFPESLRTIGQNAFNGARFLRACFMGNPDTLGYHSFSCNIIQFKGNEPPVTYGDVFPKARKVYVPCNTSDIYAEALELPSNCQIEEDCDGIVQISEMILNIAPNPAHGEVTVSLPEGLSSFHARLVLRDATGREVRSMEASNPTVKMPLQGLVQGTYLLTLMTDKGSSTQKLVVE